MCYSGLCKYENYQGDCTWNGRHPYPCPEPEYDDEDIKTGTQKLAEEAAEAYECYLSSLGD